MRKTRLYPQIVGRTSLATRLPDEPFASETDTFVFTVSHNTKSSRRA
jgi:hypothetical protein